MQMVNVGGSTTSTTFVGDEREASNSYCKAFYCGGKGWQRRKKEEMESHRNPQEDVLIPFSGCRKSLNQEKHQPATSQEEQEDEGEIKYHLQHSVS